MVAVVAWTELIPSAASGRWSSDRGKRSIEPTELLVWPKVRLNLRRAIIQILMEMDCIPAGMELFPAADEEQFQFIKSIIDDCDYYILIVGGRYGSTTPDGLSYMEKEYDYARQKGVKVLSFIHDKPSDIPFGKSEADPALRARLDRFRDKVITGSIVKLSPMQKSFPQSCP